MKYMVAIIEDSPAEANVISSHFARFAPESGADFDVKWFQSGDTFLFSYQPIYDLVMIDIDLPGLNGMETAERLRRTDQSVTLLFVTNLAQYATKGYVVDAIDFLLKPVSYAVFTVTIQRALQRCLHNHQSDMLINISDGVYRISPSRIKYIEVSNHTLIYHTTEGVLTSLGSLKDIEKLLPAKQFVRCNRCYLVNLAFVQAVRGHSLILDTEELQISRPKRTALLEALNSYLGGGT